MVELCDAGLGAGVVDRCYIYEERLRGGAGEGAEKVVEVFFAGGAGGYEGVGFFEVFGERVELQSTVSVQFTHPIFVGQHTCSAAQHTFPVSHFAPQIPTNCFRTSSSGSSARPLSGQGSSGEKKLDLPQLPRMAQRPASWMGVMALEAEERERDARPKRRVRRRGGLIVDRWRCPAPWGLWLVGML